MLGLLKGLDCDQGRCEGEALWSDLPVPGEAETLVETPVGQAFRVAAVDELAGAQAASSLPELAQRCL